MDTVLVGFANSNMSNSAARYTSPSSVGSVWNTAETGARSLCPINGTIKQLRIALNNTPGAGKNYTFTLYVNGSPTALTCTIADAANEGSDTTHTVSVSTGDTLSIEALPSGTPSAAVPFWSLILSGSTASQSGFLCGFGQNLSALSTQYRSIATGGDGNSTETAATTVFPTGGTLKNMRIALAAAPGSGNSYAFTVRHAASGGTMADTSITCTISNTDTTGSDLSNTLAITAGDKVSLKVVPASGPTATTAAICFEFDPTTDGESVLMGCSASLNTASTRYMHWDGVNNSWVAAESSYNTPMPATTLKKLYVELSAAPGSGKSYAFTARDNEANSSVVATVADTATTANDTSNTATISAGEYSTLQCVPASTPGAATAMWGIVSYIAPAAGGFAGAVNGVSNATLGSVNGVAKANISTVNGVV